MRATVLSAMLLTGVAVWLAPPIAFAAPPPNPSMEVEDPSNALEPLSWEHNAWFGAGGVLDATFSYPSMGGKDGNRYVRIEISRKSGEGDAKWWTVPYVPDAGGGGYRVTDWYRANVKSKLMVFCTDGGARTEWIQVAELPPTNGWEQADGTVDLPEWTTQVRLVHTLADVGYVDVDAMTATRMMGGGAKSKARIAITWDDGWKSSKLGIESMDRRNIKGTHFIVSEYTDSPKFKYDYLETPEIKTVLRAEHEISSHSLLHEDLSKMSPEYLEQNIVKSKAELELFGTPCHGIASPFGFYTPYVIERTKVTYKYHRTVQPGINVQPYKLHELYGVVVDNEMKLEDLEAYVEDTRTQDGLLILVFHRVSEEAPLASFVKPSVLDKMFDYLLAANTDMKPLGEHLGFWTYQPIPPDPPVVYPVDHSDQGPIGSFERVFGRGADDEGCRTTPRSARAPWIPFSIAALFTAWRLRRRRAVGRSR